MSAPAESSSEQPNPLELYIRFPFDSDEAYQQGLAGLIAGGALEGNPPPEVREEIMRRTRVFYFNRITGRSITTEQAREAEQQSGARHSTQPAATPSLSQSSRTESNNPPNIDIDSQVLTFAELQEMIETGNVDKIPNNKIIPERINDAPPSESTAPVRKKPWELANAQT